MLAATVLVVAPADARSGAQRDGHHFPASVKTTVPAGGGSMITTPTIGKGVKTLKVTVRPQADIAAEEEAVYDQFVNTIGNLSKGKRLLVCVMMYQLLSAPDDTYGDSTEIDAFHFSGSGAVLLACLQMAGLLQSSTPSRAFAPARGAFPPSARATGPCGQSRPSLPATLEKTEDGYSLTASGSTKKAKKPKLRVGCTVKGNKVTYKVRATQKGVPLRRVVGKQLRVGIQSPPDASTSVPVKVTFATP